MRTSQLASAIVGKNYIYCSTFYFELLLYITLSCNITFTDASWRKCRTKSYHKDSQ